MCDHRRRLCVSDDLSQSSLVAKMIDRHFAAILNVYVYCVERPSASVNTDNLPKLPPIIIGTGTAVNKYPAVGNNARTSMAEIDEEELYPRNYGSDEGEQCCRN